MAARTLDERDGHLGHRQPAVNASCSSCTTTAWPSASMRWSGNDARVSRRQPKKPLVQSRRGIEQTART